MSSTTFDSRHLQDYRHPHTVGQSGQCAATTQEADPNGKDPHEPGAKLDVGKNRLGLVLHGFARALWAVGEVGTYGAAKYTPHGWESVPDGEERYLDALYRHQLMEACGETHDPDSGLLHAAHAAWNALARLELLCRRTEKK